MICIIGGMPRTGSNYWRFLLQLNSKVKDISNLREPLYPLVVHADQYSLIENDFIQFWHNHRDDQGWYEEKSIDRKTWEYHTKMEDEIPKPLNITFAQDNAEIWLCENLGKFRSPLLFIYPMRMPLELLYNSFHRWVKWEPEPFVELLGKSVAAAEQLKEQLGTSFLPVDIEATMHDLRNFFKLIYKRMGVNPNTYQASFMKRRVKIAENLGHGQYKMTPSVARFKLTTVELFGDIEERYKALLS